jgi:hypothetical protein
MRFYIDGKHEQGWSLVFGTVSEMAMRQAA